MSSERLIHLDFLLKQILIISVIFLILEVFIRAFIISPDQLNNYGYNSDGLGDLLPNKNFVDKNIKYLPYSVVTNSQGLRNKEEIDFSDDVHRILVIGDSFTYGPYVNNQDTWPSILERKLRETQKDKKIQVLNAGVSGYTITDELNYLKEKGIKIKPDLIILGIYANDINDLLPEKRKIYSRSMQKMKEKGLKGYIYKIIKRTAIFNFIERSRTSYSRNKNNINQNNSKLPENVAYFEQYQQQFNEFLEFCQINKIKMLVISFPEITQLMQNKDNFFKSIKNTSKYKFDYIDIAEKWKNEKLEDLYLLPINNHLSQNGYFNVSHLIINYLKENKLLDI